MASEQEVKEYLAYWFQLGKKVWIGNGQECLQPPSVIEGDRYSQAFERLWQRILASEKDCYLEGTEQTIRELLSSDWQISSCARCEMPVPMIDIGIQPMGCPCTDLPNWPNLDLPTPRSPISSSNQLSQIRERLNQIKEPS